MLADHHQHDNLLISIAANRLFDNGVMMLAPALQHMMSLRYLDLSGAQCLFICSGVHITAADNLVGVAGAVALSGAFSRLSSLQNVNLRRAYPRPHGMRCLKAHREHAGTRGAGCHHRQGTAAHARTEDSGHAPCVAVQLRSHHTTLYAGNHINLDTLVRLLSIDALFPSSTFIVEEGSRFSSCYRLNSHGADTLPLHMYDVLSVALDLPLEPTDAGTPYVTCTYVD